MKDVLSAIIAREKLQIDADMVECASSGGLTEGVTFCVPLVRRPVSAEGPGFPLESSVHPFVLLASAGVLHCSLRIATLRAVLVAFRSAGSSLFQNPAVPCSEYPTKPSAPQVAVWHAACDRTKLPPAAGTWQA